MKYIYIILFVVFVTSCVSVTETDFATKYVSYNDFGEIIELKGEVFDLDTIWKPSRIFSVDSKVTDIFINCENMHGRMIYIVSVPTNQH